MNKKERNLIEHEVQETEDGYSIHLSIDLKFLALVIVLIVSIVFLLSRM